VHHLYQIILIKIIKIKISIILLIYHKVNKLIIIDQILLINKYIQIKIKLTKLILTLIIINNKINPSIK
jgi:hypothetical protein